MREGASWEDALVTRVRNGRASFAAGSALYEIACASGAIMLLAPCSASFRMTSDKRGDDSYLR